LKARGQQCASRAKVPESKHLASCQKWTPDFPIAARALGKLYGQVEDDQKTHPFSWQHVMRLVNYQRESRLMFEMVFRAERPLRQLREGDFHNTPHFLTGVDAIWRLYRIEQSSIVANKSPFQRDMSSERSNGTEAVRHVKLEIDRLTVEQSRALKDAIYVGMTLDEARKFYERRHQITKLLEELALLEKAQ
jgi:hypothetical protein